MSWSILYMSLSLSWISSTCTTCTPHPGHMCQPGCCHQDWTEQKSCQRFEITLRIPWPCHSVELICQTDCHSWSTSVQWTVCLCGRQGLMGTQSAWDPGTGSCQEHYIRSHDTDTWTRAPPPGARTPVTRGRGRGRPEGVAHERASSPAQALQWRQHKYRGLNWATISNLTWSALFMTTIRFNPTS